MPEKSRFRKCLYCSKQADSKEHILPASLGGHRERRGILCADCNSAMGPLVDALVSEIGPLSGMLGVSNTRTREKIRARLESDSGPLTLDERGRPALEVPQVLTERLRGDGKKVVQMNFSSERQYQEWLQSERHQGRSPKQLSRVEQVRYLSDSPVLKFSIGCEASRRAVAQIAYNLLAHIAPSVAREPGLQGLRDYIRHGNDGTPRTVELLAIPRERIVGPRFEFGHQILVAQDGNAISSIVRLFGTLDFLVRMGESARQFKGVVADIDPLASGAPRDFECRELSHGLSELDKYTLPDSADAVAGPLSNLLERIRERQWRLDTAPLLVRLNELRTKGVPIDRDNLRLLLGDYSSRVRDLAFGLDAATAKLAQERTSGRDGGAGVRLRLNAFVQILRASDPSDPSGLTEAARGALDYAMQQVTEVAHEELVRGELTEPILDSILRGVLGEQAILEGVLKLLPSQSNDRSTL